MYRPASVSGRRRTRVYARCKDATPAAVCLDQIIYDVQNEKKIRHRMKTGKIASGKVSER